MKFETSISEQERFQDHYIKEEDSMLDTESDEDDFIRSAPPYLNTPVTTVSLMSGISETDRSCNNDPETSHFNMLPSFGGKLEECQS